jgi:hypothetical protein
MGDDEGRESGEYRGDLLRMVVFVSWYNLVFRRMKKVIEWKGFVLSIICYL